MAIIASPITARPITASRIAARGVETGSAAGAAAMPWLFNFNAKMTALPTALQRMNATYTRYSVKNVVQDGVLVQLADNQFGTSYDDVTGLYGYVPEPAATNKLGKTEDFGDAYWTKNRMSVDPTPVVAPDGTSTGRLLTATGTVAPVSLYKAVTSSSSDHTASIFFKAGNHAWWRFMWYDGSGNQVRVWFNALTASIGSTTAGGTATFNNALIRSIGNGWYRLSVSGSVTNGNAVQLSPQDGNGSTNATSVNGATIYLWGAQLETGLRMTSYISNSTTGTATRAADVLSVPLANIPGFSSAGYTLFVDYRADTLNGTGFSQRIVQVDDGTDTQRLAILRTASNIISLAGTGIDVPSVAQGLTRLKYAGSAQVNNFKGAIGGAALTQDSAGSMPASPTTLRIGVSSSNASLASGYIFRAGLIPQALTQAQINAMTVL